MPSGLKELLVIVCLCLPVWLFARRPFGRIVGWEDYDRRLSLWLVVTAAGLLAPNIFVYALATAPLFVLAARRDSNPQALCIMVLFAAPPVEIPLGAGILNYIFDLSPYRVIALSIMLPSVLRWRKTGRGWQRPEQRLVLGLAWAFVLICVAVNSPQEPATGVVRRLANNLIDVMLPLYFFAHCSGSKDRSRIDDILATLCLAGLLMAAVAVFERLTGWLLYVGVGERWGSPNIFAYLLRGDALRAQASAGHSIFAGYWIALAMCACLYLLALLPSERRFRYALALLLVGLWATFSRGPWLTAAIFALVYYALDPRGPARLFRFAVTCVGAAVVLPFTTFGRQIVSFIPGFGDQEVGSIDYRKQLADAAIDVILANPLTGDALALSKLESLRQGQGIIDIINGYIWIGLFNGLVAVGLFVCMLAVPVYTLVSSWTTSRWLEPHLAHQSAVLAAILLGTLVFIATAGYGQLTFILIGTAVCLAATQRQEISRALRQRSAPMQGSVHAS